MKRKKMKNYLINFLLIILFIVGLLLIFNNQIKNVLIERTGNSYSTQKVNEKEINQNKEKTVSFDFDAVKPASTEAVLQAQLNNNDLPIIGWIAVPDVDISLPIFKGLSNEVLLYGAGTLSPTQEMGQGNYSLASHRLDNERLLFTPLDHVSLGDFIYLTDLTNIYTYKTTLNERVEPTQVSLIEEVPGKELITLITCGEMSGETRRVVQGELQAITLYQDTPQNIQDMFNKN